MRQQASISASLSHRNALAACTRTQRRSPSQTSDVRAPHLHISPLLRAVCVPFLSLPAFPPPSLLLPPSLPPLPLLFLPLFLLFPLLFLPLLLFVSLLVYPPSSLLFRPPLCSIAREKARSSGWARRDTPLSGWTRHRTPRCRTSFSACRRGSGGESGDRRFGGERRGRKERGGERWEERRRAKRGTALLSWLCSSSPFSHLFE
mmetsp:Transcript_16314/g.41356  ORF Transcript_16314/g.41356 Transcript_16314/m.41356 type:complete len:204 (-) Transcript_16314:221-832(-)